MTDTVKFIFKTLIKVPVFIAIAFIILNLVAFGLSYFKVLGASFVVLQTAVENNYIPAAEKDSLNNYLKSQESEMLSDFRLGGTTANIDEPNQYGTEMNIGVTATFRPIWPLMVNEQTRDGEGIQGISDSRSFSGYLSDSELEAEREKKRTNNEIRIVYNNVPGLKYYPSLEVE